MGDGNVLPLDSKVALDILEASINSMSIALKMLRNLRLLIPQCVIIVDGWHCLTEYPGSNRVIVEEFLRGVIVLFGDLNGGCHDLMEDAFWLQLLEL